MKERNITILSQVKINESPMSLDFEGFRPFTNLEDYRNEEDSNFYINAVIPIRAKRDCIKEDELINKYGYKECMPFPDLDNVYFCYIDIKEEVTEINESADCRAFDIVYRSQVKSDEIYDIHLIKVKYAVDVRPVISEGVVVSLRDLSIIDPETDRGTVTSPRKNDGGGK